MLFDNTYPNTPINGKEVMYKGDGYVRFDALNPCFHCGTLTQWASLSFEAPLCSQECAEAEWGEYWMATEFPT